jgi:hypothetical protein
MRVWVQPVQGAQPGEIEVAEDVLGDQRWAEQQREMRGEDRHPQHACRQRARRQQHRHIAGGHDQRERLEAARGDAHVQTLQGPGQPARPAAATRRDVLRRLARSPRGEQEGAREHAEQTEQAERAQRARRARRSPRAGGRSPAGGSHRAPAGGQGGGRLHAFIVTALCHGAQQLIGIAWISAKSK